jgi:hypothetical protein
MTRDQLQDADRWLLVMYLEYWGYQVYDHETTDELRAVALANHDTETAGHALALEDYTRGE